MEHESKMSLVFQHPACHECQWHQGAQRTLTSLIHKDIPISEASIVCTPKNTMHATVQADAYTLEEDPDAQNHFALIADADLFCIRRAEDPSFVPIPEEID